MVQIDSVKGLVSRDPGAWMAVFKGTLVGTFGGGHLEFVALGRFGPLLFFVRHAALQPTDFHLEIGLSRAHDGQSTAFLCHFRLLPSASHPSCANFQRHAHELELGFGLFQPPAC